jgi:hypothetical protein
MVALYLTQSSACVLLEKMTTMLDYLFYGQYSLLLLYDYIFMGTDSHDQSDEGMLLLAHIPLWTPLNPTVYFRT